MSGGIAHPKKWAKMNVCNYKKKRDKPADTIRVFGMSVDSKYQTTIN